MIQLKKDHLRSFSLVYDLLSLNPAVMNEYDTFFSVTRVDSDIEAVIFAWYTIATFLY